MMMSNHWSHTAACCAKRERFAGINAAGAALLLGLLALPWLHVSCGNQRVSSPSGFNIMTGIIDGQLSRTMSMLNSDPGAGLNAGGPGPAADGSMVRQKDASKVRQKYFPTVRPLVIAFAVVLAAWGVFGAMHVRTLMRRQAPQVRIANVAPRDAWLMCGLGGAGFVLLMTCRVMIGSDATPPEGPPGLGAVTVAFTVPFYGSMAACVLLAAVGAVVGRHVSSVGQTLPAQEAACASAGISMPAHGSTLGTAGAPPIPAGDPQTGVTWTATAGGWMRAAQARLATLVGAFVSKQASTPRETSGPDDRLSRAATAFVLGLAITAVVAWFVIKPKSPQAARAAGAVQPAADPVIEHQSGDGNGDGEGDGDGDAQLHDDADFQDLIERQRLAQEYGLQLDD